MTTKRTKTKKVAAAPKKAGGSGEVKKSSDTSNPFNPLFVEAPKKKEVIDMYRYVRWPRNVRIQRQRKILFKRLKIPPPVNQFNQGLDKQTAAEILKFFRKYRPESKQEKKSRLLKRAEGRTVGEPEVPTPRRPRVVFGGNEVTKMIEQKKAKVVLISHDVDPIELVIFLPFLCRKMGVPYAIVKGKSRLGDIVRRKTATCLCLTEVYPEDKAQLNKICDTVKTNYNDRFDEIRKQWGGGVLPKKRVLQKREFEPVAIE